MIEILHKDSGEALARFDVDSLVGADLTERDLRGADLRGADLRGADLRGTRTGEALFDGSLKSLEQQYPGRFLRIHRNALLARVYAHTAELTGDPGNPVTTWTQAQIDANQLVYVHDGSNTTSDAVTFTVDDGQGNSLAGQRFELIVSAEPDPPPNPPDPPDPPDPPYPP